MQNEFQFTPIDPEITSCLPKPDRLPSIHPAHRIFTNTNLPLKEVKLMGFDMDYTLAIYHKEPMEQLQYDLTIHNLVKKMAYPKEILELKYDPNFIIRGLLVDKRTGVLYKIDAQGNVIKAFQGKKDVSFDFKDRLSMRTANQLSAEYLANLDTLFSMPEACLFSNLVEFFLEKFVQKQNLSPLELEENHETGNLGPINTWKLFDDVRAAIDGIHRDNSLKSEILSNLPKYIYIDPNLALTLHKLRSSGKKLFLLTNSYWNYTNKLMSFMLDGQLKLYDNWRKYFDIVLVGGRKPGFFNKREEFLEVNLETNCAAAIGTTDQQFSRLKVYQGGNMESFERMSGFYGHQILYVGDHIFGDILRSKKDSGWRTCLIVEELEKEICTVLEQKESIEKLDVIDERRHKLDDAIAEQRALLNMIEAAILRHEDREESKEPETEITKLTHISALKSISEEEKNHNLLLLRNAQKLKKKEIDNAKRILRKLDKEVNFLQENLASAFNPYWGRLLKAGNELSRFGDQVKIYADTYTSKVSNFLHYSPMHRFHSPRELMTHDYHLAHSRGLGNILRVEDDES